MNSDGAVGEQSPGGEARTRLLSMYFEATAPEGERLPHVANVSWPRSGHHLLVRMLTLYFGSRFGYCEFYGPHAAPRCCRARPCARPGRISMAKNHDFRLETVLPEGRPVIVQVRRPGEAIVSEFELHVRAGHPDTAAEFARFAARRAARYRAFRERWVDPPSEQRLVLWYEDLCEDPVASLAGAAAMFGESRIDAARARRILADLPHQTVADGKLTLHRRAGVRPGRDTRAFRFYDEAVFEAIAAEAGAPAGGAAVGADGVGGGEEIP